MAAVLSAKVDMMPSNIEERRFGAGSVAGPDPGTVFSPRVLAAASRIATAVCRPSFVAWAAFGMAESFSANTSSRPVRSGVFSLNSSALPVLQGMKEHRKQLQ